MRKKAQAQIIVTVLIILLVIAAIAIVASVITNLVRQGGQDIVSQTECINTQLEITQANNGSNQIVVRNSGQGDVSGVVVLLNGITEETTNETLTPLQTAVVDISPDNLTSGDEIEAGATINVEGETVSCGIKAETTVA